MKTTANTRIRNMWTEQQESMNQLTCIVLTHQQHSLAPDEKRTFDDTTKTTIQLNTKEF